MKMPCPVSSLQRIVPVSICAVLLLFALGCGGRSSAPAAPEEDEITRYLAEHPEEAANEEAPEEQLNADE